jgi:hypothetical protein
MLYAVLDRNKFRDVVYDWYKRFICIFERPLVSGTLNGVESTPKKIYPVFM